MPVEIRFHCDDAEGVIVPSDDARREGDQILVRRGLDWSPVTKRKDGRWDVGAGGLGAGLTWERYTTREFTKVEAMALLDWASVGTRLGEAARETSETS